MSDPERNASLLSSDCAKCSLSTLCLPIGLAKLLDNLCQCDRCGEVFYTAVGSPLRRLAKPYCKAAVTAANMGGICQHCLSGMYDGWKKEINFDR